MINLQHLEQLITVAKEGTLSGAAEVLLISQPSLTRNMRQLEDDLGIQLFQRSKNKLSLTATGEYTVQQAEALLNYEQQFLRNIQRFSLQATTLFGGISAPGVEWEVRNRLAEHDSEQEVLVELHDNDSLLEALLDQKFQFIVTDFPIEHEDVLTTGFFKEQLYISVPPAHPYAMREEITLDDLSNLTMLLRSDLGIWQPLVDQLSQTKFIVQTDWDAFNELISASALPSFSTNITQAASENPNQRVHVPIIDEQATKTFYISTLKKNKSVLMQLT
ncbi:LysR family transcriptional regulator [Streptococcus cuniculipharyngis]|uniref:LysR family transcriptional regulator n=1 Tax=Streptococcus cuniculipharyngis TaxID=1562651 RepID=A0A5C5SFA0_9STRE|nr:LysR family transcriptional regulator [Streptococcus cuniculipharyngis]TWS98788.1 LysR family transcriptional regulator [Streptococcus cuniculipharyngis]